MTRPLPLSVPINARPPSDRLPLAFRRPLGGKPEDGGHAPSVPGRIPVAKSWGFAAYEAADAAVCAVQAQAAAGVSLDWAHLPKGSAGTSACIAAATADTAALHLGRTVNHTPSVRRAGCTRAASKDAPPLRHCGQSTTAAAASRYRCTPAAQTAAGRLKTCIRPRHGATDGAGICRHGYTAPAAGIHTCCRAENGAAKIPPCEYYPLPIPEPQPDGLKTYICEPRPKADRMHLRFRRKKLGHAADRIPLAFACHTVQGVPVRKAYIMLNRVGAARPNLADTGTGRPLAGRDYRHHADRRKRKRRAENHTKRGHRPLYGQIRERLKMNVLQRLNAVLDRKSTGVAKITGHLGGSAWAAQSQTGGNLILTGEAEMGGRVFYDQHTNRITGRAPDLAVTDLPLV